MAVDVDQSPAQGLMNGTSPSPPPAEQERLYDQLLHLRDVVLAGKHAQFKLPPSAVEQLKASLLVPSEPRANDGNATAANGQAFATNIQQQSRSSSFWFAPFGALPGLQHADSPAAMAGLPRPTAASRGAAVELDPIFLQKSDQLVREETRLKRQRIERDLLAQVEQRRQQSSRDKDAAVEVSPCFDLNAVLRTTMQNVKHVSGVKAAGSRASSSFDENDYYSSLVQSDWSSDASSTKGSDRAIGAFTDDFERLDGSASKGKRPVIPGSTMPNASKDRPHVYANEPDNVDEEGEDDDEYTPPDAAAFDSSRVHKGDVNMQPLTPDDDDSDYEPGEITAAESADPSPRYQPQQRLQPPANVPVIRNHLTHIAAPQPNRVSPLTTANQENIELELVNGRPELVHKPMYHTPQMSRMSSASPTGNSGPGPSKHKKKQKKRKRDNEPQGRNKRRQKQAEMEVPPPPVNEEPYIKPEPMSPPQFFADVPAAPQQLYRDYRPPQVDLTGPRPMPQPQYAYDSQPRHHWAAPEPQQVIRAASPAHRPVQRDTQDLRRVASLHHAKRPVSPQRNEYSPVAPYRAASMAYGDPRLRAPEQPSYDPRLRSPAVSQRYEDTYSSRAASPALMPPPPLPAQQPARRIVQDQYGNKYYAAESAPSQPSTIRASAVPESYERAPSGTTYAQPSAPSHYYGPPEDRMPPPPSARHQAPSGGVEEPFEYTDADGYLIRAYRVRPSERPAQPQQQARYSEAPTSPIYQEYRPYESMPPPPPPPATQPSHRMQEPTSPTYNPSVSRSYSVRPEQAAPPPQNYLRQASVAPVQYVPLRQESEAPAPYAPQQAAPAPQRAMSVMPTGYEYAGAQQQPQSQPQPQPRYVDQYGNPVYPREVRMVGQVDEGLREYE